MQKNIDWKAARELLLNYVNPMNAVPLSLEDWRVPGAVLAEDVFAGEDVPPFDRSPYDGYAFRAADTAGADRACPITLRILEEIPAGSVWTQPVTPGIAVKVLTGAPIPPGADAVVKFEETEFTDDTVTVFSSFTAGENIIRRGEDVKAGQFLAERGTVVDPALAGVLAAQHRTRPLVYDRPRVGLITTGSELTEPGETPAPGRIVNTNRSILSAALRRAGCEPFSLHRPVRDDPYAIAEAIRETLPKCDMLITTGGVSVGDYDYTPAAMERAGAELLVRRLAVQPGGACAYAVKDGKLICGLSGNPAAALTNFYAVVLPALQKLCGYGQPRLTELPVTLAEDFPKNTTRARLVRGRLDLTDGTARMRLAEGQGSGILHSLAGCDLLAEIPAGSGPLPAGTRLTAWLIP